LTAESGADRPGSGTGSQGVSAAASQAGFIKSGAGTWNIGAASAYNAANFGFTLNQGTVIVTGNNSFGGANSVLTINGGTIQASGGQTFANSSIVVGGDFTLTGTGNSLFSGTVDLGSATRTITNSITSGSRQFTGVIGNSSGTAGLTHAGSATTTLTNANTYNGITTISAGTLQLTGSGSINSSPTISIGSAGTFDVSGVTGGYTLGSAAVQTLQGTGTVSGAVTVANNAVIRGDSATGTGALKTAGVTVQTGGKLLVQLGAGTTASSLDASASGGILNLNTNAIIDLDGTLAGGSRTIATVAGTAGRLVVGGTTYDTDATIATHTSAGGAGSVVTFGNIQLDLTGYTLANGDVFTLSRSGNNLVLAFAPVPEPATVLAVGAAGLGLAGWVRRKRKAKTEVTA
jgi:autotransporter-associated beta strand protein